MTKPSSEKCPFRGSNIRQSPRIQPGQKPRTCVRCNNQEVKTRGVSALSWNGAAESAVDIYTSECQ